MSANGFVGFDVAGFDPVDDGFARYPAELAGFEYGENVFHGARPFVRLSVRLIHLFQELLFLSTIFLNYFLCNISILYVSGWFYLTYEYV